MQESAIEATNVRKNGGDADRSRPGFRRSSRRETTIRRAVLAIVALPLAAVILVLGLRAADDIERYRATGDVAEATQVVTRLSRLETALILEQVDALDLVSVATSDFAESELLTERIRPDATEAVEARFAASVVRTDAALNEALSAGDLNDELRARMDVLTSVRERSLERNITPAELDLFYDRFADSAGQAKAQPTSLLANASNPEIREGTVRQRQLTTMALGTAALRRDLTTAVGRLAAFVNVEWDSLATSSRRTRVAVEAVDEAGRDHLGPSWQSASGNIYDALDSVDTWSLQFQAESPATIDAALDDMLAARRTNLDHTILTIDLLEQNLEDIGVSTSSDQRRALTSLSLTAALLVAVLVLAASFAIRIGQSIISPLELAAGMARKVGEGNLDVEPISAEGPAEVAEVSEALNSLVRSVDLIKQQAEALGAANLDAPVLNETLPGDLGRSLEASIGVWRRATEEAQHANAVTKAVAEATSDAQLTFDDRMEVIDANPAAAALFGRTRSELRGEALKSLLHTNSNDVTEALERSGIFAGEATAKSTDGDIQTIVTATRVSTNSTIVHSVSIRDVSVRQQLIDRLTAQVRRDRLTGLVSRARLFELLTDRLTSGSAGVVVVSLDRFKMTNDRFGQEIGDRVLMDVADRLTRLTREGDILARTGGDEFVVVPGIAGSGSVSSPLGLEQLRQRAETVLTNLQRPYEIDGRTIAVSASVGVAAGSDDAERAVLDATLAAQEAKVRGGGLVQAYDAALKERLADRDAIRDDLIEALENDELVLWYQPVVDAGDGSLVGLEALVRWPKPDGTMVQPGEFIPIAEESNLIVRLDEWVIDRACRQLAEWTDGEMSQVHIAINVSARHLSEGELAVTVAASSKRWSVAPERLAIEITESYLADDVDQLREVLAEVHRGGNKLLMDDFGTGYSSLSYLQELPFDVLKIDRAFVNKLGDSRQSRIIAETLITLGKTLDMTVLAEGIETHEQAEILTAMGVDQLQGFFIARPMAPELLRPRYSSHEETSR